MQDVVQRRIRRVRLTLTALACLSLVGCYNTIETSKVESPYNYTVPGRDPVSLPLDTVFTCMRKTGALEGQGFAVGPFTNDTGTRNEVATGGTGSFIPTGPNVSIYAMEAIASAGGIVFDRAFWLARMHRAVCLQRLAPRRTVTPRFGGKMAGCRFICSGSDVI
jgi:hypothetical protein